MNIIEFKNVSKKFGENLVLDDVNLSIKKGEFVSIVGASGSGKTTILNIMGLLEDFTSGKVLMNGKDLPKLNSKQAVKIRRNNINYLFQSFALIEDKTVYENLKLSLNFAGNIDKDKVIQDVLKKVHLSEKNNSIVSTLSGGEKQRISLARSIIKPGDIILADEPTGALDPKLAMQAFNLILQMQKESGKTIVMVTHNIDQAKQTDRIIELRK